MPFAGSETSVHWAMMQSGNLLLRDDSAMNLSPRMFKKYIAPYDGRLLKEFGGGAIHFCGRGDHYIAQAAELEGMATINMSQPEYNNMETIFEHTVDKGITIIGLPREAAEDALARGRNLTAGTLQIKSAVSCCSGPIRPMKGVNTRRGVPK